MFMCLLHTFEHCFDEETRLSILIFKLPSVVLSVYFSFVFKMRLINQVHLCVCVCF